MSSRSAEAPPRASRWSLATRLTAWYGFSAFAILVVATGLLYWALAATLDREEDLFLSDDISLLRTLVRGHDDRMLVSEIEEESMARQFSRVYVRLLDADGHTLLQTRGMDDYAQPALFPPPLPLGSDLARGVGSVSAAGAPCQIAAARAERRDGSQVTLQVALDTTRHEATLASFRRWAQVVLVTALGICAVVGFVIARSGMRPVADMAAGAARIHATTLHERIDLSGLPRELGALARTFNEMLDRLESSFDRINRFSSEIAHELRTPVNVLVSEVGVALGKARTEAEYREVLGSMLEESEKLGRLIDRLLFLARSEHPEAEIEREDVEVFEKLGSFRDFFGAKAEEAGVEVEVERGDAAELHASLDRGLIGRAVGNLVENAINYSRGKRIVLGARRDGADLRIEVRDDGVGIAAHDQEHLFDRFYRVEAARGASRSGVGLGLPIVKSIAGLHGGRVEVASEPGKGTCVTLVLPFVAPGAV